MESKLLDKIKNYKEIEVISKKIRKDKKLVVMVSGCFDLLHFGHALFFEQAKKYGNVLIVSVGSDETIKKLKGLNRPIHDQNTRAGLVASQGLVDFVVIAEEPLKQNGMDYSILLNTIKPDIMVLRSDDAAIKDTVNILGKFGGKVRLVSRLRPPKIKFVSTTSVIEKIKKLPN